MKTIITVLILAATGCCPGYQKTGSVLTEVVFPPASSSPEPVPQTKKAPALDWEKIKNLPYISKNTPNTPLSTTVSPGEVYISEGIRKEVKWAIIKELRDRGYSVTTRSSKSSFKLKISLKRIADRIVCTAILYDQDNLIISQGIGEGKYWWFSSTGGRYIRIMKEKMRYQGEIDAALEAVRMVVAGN